MAAITFTAADQAEHVRGSIETALTGLREMLDAFVGYRIRLAAAAAEHARPRQASRRPTVAPEHEGERPGVFPASEPATVTAPFQPLDPDIVSTAIPAFFIGRNRDGFWVARDARGKIGGLFLFENSALAFAMRNSPPTGCATIFPAHRFELDLENSGNPLIPCLGPLMRLATPARQRNRSPWRGWG